MRVAMLTTIDASMSWFVIPYAYKMKEKGNDVTLMCAMSDEFYNKYKNDFNCVRLDLSRGFNLKKTIKAYLFFLNHFKKNKYDMIEYATDNVSFPCSIASRIRKIPIRIYNQWGVLYIGYTGIKKVITKFIERTSIRNSTQVRQVSARNLEFCYCHKLYNKKTSVKVLGKGGTVGVDLAKFNVENKTNYRNEIRSLYGIPKKAFLFGYVGRIQTDKGTNELLEAFKLLLSKNKNLYLMLVGFIDSAKQIKKENMEWAKSCKNVIFTGRVFDTEKYMSSFDLLVHPTYREGFGMVLQEAGAMKTPVLTTNIIGPSEFITNLKTGILVEPKNTESLINGMKFCYENPDLLKDMSEKLYVYTITYFERNKMINNIVNDRLNLLEERKCSN